MPTWKESIVVALRNLGGVAPLRDIYQETQRLRGGEINPVFTASIRKTIEDHSSDSENFRSNRDDLFFSAKGLGAGIWGLREKQILTPHADDIHNPPDRILTDVYRILRDTALARSLKQLYKDECQICGITIHLPGGTRYSEAHHIKALGAPHNGPDIAENIMVLCPNHHAMLDFHAMSIVYSTLRIHKSHKIDLAFINYHNAQIKAGSELPTTLGNRQDA